MYINQQTKTILPADKDHPASTTNTTFQYLLDDLCKPIMTNLLKKIAHLQRLSAQRGGLLREVKDDERLPPFTGQKKGEILFLL